jgi:hypothetical protein
VTATPTAQPDRGAGTLISVLVPVWQQPEPLVPLYYEYAAPLKERGWVFEFIFICEPGFDIEIAQLLEQNRKGEPIRILQVAQLIDESSLFNAAVAHARGEIVITLPAYRRIEADHLPRLVDRVLEGVDLVVARRWPRKDAWINKLQNRVLHRVIRWTMGGNLRDVACGVRAMRTEVLFHTPVYGDSFRFFALLVERGGYTMEELDTPQHERDRRARIYRPGLYLRRIVDLLGIFVILRFTARPLRFFGPLGATMMLGGGIALGVAAVLGLGPIGSVGRVILLTGIFLLVLGIQTMAIGLIGEMMVFLQAPTQSRYRIVERIN